MYDKKEIDRLTGLYMGGQRDVIGKLLEAIVPMIDIILLGKYNDMKSDFDDLRQEVLIRLKQILERNPDSLYVSFDRGNISGYYHFKIREILQGRHYNFVRKIRDEYDTYRGDVDFFSNLSKRNKRRLGIEVIGKEAENNEQ